MNLNLGSGSRPLLGWVNLDINPDHDGVDVVHDLNDLPLPFENDSFEMVLAAHILEHIINPIPVMNELYRITKNGGVIRIEAPHNTNPMYFDDPTHVTPFGDFTISFMCDPQNAKQLGMKGRFIVLNHEILGVPGSRERPTCVVANIQVIK